MKLSNPLSFQSLPTLLDGKKPSTLSPRLLARAKVPGGWLVGIGANQMFSGVTFYPDPQHKWDGASLD